MDQTRLRSREELELLKLETEIEELRRGWLRRPASWVAVATTILAVGGFFSEMQVNKVHAAATDLQLRETEFEIRLKERESKQLTEDLERRARELEQVMTDLSSRSQELKEIGELLASELGAGTAFAVVSVSAEGKLLSLNGGTNHGLNRGQSFFIWRAGELIGMGRIESLRDEIATARLTTTVSGKTVSAADQVLIRGVPVTK